MKKHEIKYEKTITQAVEEINKKKSEGTSIHPMTEEGLKAIDIANMLVGTIMKRNQPDISFFKFYMNSTNDRLNLMSPKDKTNKNKGPKSLRRKRSSRTTSESS